jgi:predicted GIY-YIG superfamily endonuclease
MVIYIATSAKNEVYIGQTKNLRKLKREYLNQTREELFPKKQEKRFLIH